MFLRHVTSFEFLLQAPDFLAYAGFVFRPVSWCNKLYTLSWIEVYSLLILAGTAIYSEINSLSYWNQQLCLVLSCLILLVVALCGGHLKPHRVWNQFGHPTLKNLYVFAGCWCKLSFVDRSSPLLWCSCRLWGINKRDQLKGFSLSKAKFVPLFVSLLPFVFPWSPRSTSQTDMLTVHSGSGAVIYLSRWRQLFSRYCVPLQGIVFP